MKSEEKDLLLKDLCARLPYGVKIQNTISKDVYNLSEMMYCLPVALATNFRPYLRPMSSMTEEEKKELLSCINKECERIQEWLKCGDFGIEQGKYHFNSDYQLDFCLSHHFDYRGLIEKGLALEAPEDMYKF